MKCRHINCILLFVLAHLPKRKLLFTRNQIKFVLKIHFSYNYFKKINSTKAVEQAVANAKPSERRKNVY